MIIDKLLYRHSLFYFIGFFLFALWGFWPSYFSHVHDQSDIRNHTHGIAMTLWCLMLIAQSYLIRANKNAVHRFIGKWSYVLMPLIVVLTINLVHSRLQTGKAMTHMDLYALALMVNATLVLLVIYGLAIYYRRKPLTHARYMICTIFPLFTPVTDRLIYAHFQPILQHLPTIDGNSIAPVAGFVLADLILIGLLLWDWRAHRRLDVFPRVLLLLLLYHISVLTFYKFAFWNSFGDWFLRLPLS